MYDIAQTGCMWESCVVKQLESLQLDWPTYIEGVFEIVSASFKSVEYAMISVFGTFRWRHIASMAFVQVFWYIFV